MTKQYNIDARKGVVPPELDIGPRPEALRENDDGSYFHTWSFFRYMLRMLDISALIIAGIISDLAVDHSLGGTNSKTMIMYFSAFVFVVLAQYFGCYNKMNMKHFRKEQIGPTIVAGLISVIVVLNGAMISGSAEEIGQAWVLAWLGVAAVLVVANRITVSIAIHRLQMAGHLRDNVAVVGDTALAAKIVSSIIDASVESEVTLVGQFDDESWPNPLLPDQRKGAPHGSIAQLIALARRSRIDRIVLALPSSDERLPILLTTLRNVPARVELCLSDNIWRFGSDDNNRLCGVPVVTLANGRIDRDITVMKNVEDRLLALALAVLLLPVLLLIALAIKLDSRGAVLFSQPRYGQNNKVFDVYKFRTMRPEASTEGDVKQATRSDPRVTRIGRFLRRSSLDELPQLLNVLKGEMSLIGPRPHAVPHNIKYAGLIDEYLARHNLKPGITGWAQVNGLRGETDTDDKMRMRVEYDLYYVENWSIMLDIKILIMTIFKVWSQKTAY